MHENEPYSLAFVETLTARNRGERSKKDDRKEKKEMGEPGERVVFVGGKTWYDDKSKTNDDDGSEQVVGNYEPLQKLNGNQLAGILINRNLRAEYVVINDDFEWRYDMLHGIGANRLSFNGYLMVRIEKR